MPSNDWQGARAAQPLVRPGPEPSWASGAVHRVPTARVSVGMLGGRRSARSVEAHVRTLGEGGSSAGLGAGEAKPGGQGPEPQRERLSIIFCV